MRMEAVAAPGKTALTALTFRDADHNKTNNQNKELM